MSRHYPLQKLVFFVVQDASSAIRQAVQEVVAHMRAHRQWAVALPEYVEELEDVGEGASLFTSGGYVDIYSAIQTQLPEEIDKQTLGDVKYLVSCLQGLSQRLSVDVEFELDGEFVGAIHSGVQDESLSEGLLGEWHRHLYPGSDA